MIPYVRPDEDGPKKSDYARIQVEEPNKVKDLFSQILGVDQVVKKDREIYLIENVRIHLDNVDGIGPFFEFEAVYENDSEEHRLREEKKVEDLMKAFEISSESLQKTSYQQLAKTSEL